MLRMKKAPKIHIPQKNFPAASLSLDPRGSRAPNMSAREQVKLPMHRLRVPEHADERVKSKTALFCKVNSVEREVNREEPLLSSRFPFLDQLLTCKAME